LFSVVDVIGLLIENVSSVGNTIGNDSFIGGSAVVVVVSCVVVVVDVVVLVVVAVVVVVVVVDVVVVVVVSGTSPSVVVDFVVVHRVDVFHGERAFASDDQLPCDYSSLVFWLYVDGAAVSSCVHVVDAAAVVVDESDDGEHVGAGVAADSEPFVRFSA
jgi:hypothetical protein